MTDPLRIQGQSALPGSVEQTRARSAGEEGKGRATPSGETTNASFVELLRARQGIANASTPAAPPTDASDAVRFSAHAQTRLQSRHIALEAEHLQRLQGAVQRVANKGARDALVLMDNLALVVSVPNRTVVTVVDKDNLKQNVFTNIDSAVIA